jgi:cytochrome c553
LPSALVRGRRIAYGPAKQEQSGDIMRKLILAALVLAPAVVLAAQAQTPTGDTPVAKDIMLKMPAPVAPFEWAYPMQPPGFKAPAPDSIHTAEGADPSIKLTMRQIGDGFGPPDWYPKEHPTLPQIVAHGEKPHVMACILCHLPNGNGHPESASISGLTVPYIIAQMHAFRDGDRQNIRAPAMVEMAYAISEKDLRTAAQYFAAIPKSQQKWIRVVETSRAPANHVGGGGARFFDKGAETVAMTPDMIYEVAESDQVELRNDHVGFVDYVPMGALAKGRIVAMGNHGQMRTCASCHGEDYRGHDDAPRIAGRSAYYLIRQLADMKAGNRKGQALGKMKDVVGKLSDADILNVAAYMASRAP